jgi:hypothetical protein
MRKSVSEALPRMYRRPQPARRRAQAADINVASKKAKRIVEPSARSEEKREIESKRRDLFRSDPPFP